MFYCCFQSASPESSIPQPPPRRHRPSKKLLVISELKNSATFRDAESGPHTAPTEENPFMFEAPEPSNQCRSHSIGSNQSEALAPGLNIIPPTPMVDRRIQDDCMELKSPKLNMLNASPKKMIATRTTSLPLVTLPDDILEEPGISSNLKSKSQENVVLNSETDPEIPESDQTDKTATKPEEAEHETKHHHQRYSMKSFKKRLKKGYKKRDRSSEHNHKTIDPNENHINLDMDSVHDDYGSHGSRSENEEYPLTDDDLLSPSDDNAFHGDKKDGFFRRMSVKVKQLVARHDEDPEMEIEHKRVKRQDKLVTITDLTDDTDGSKPIVYKKTLKEALFQSQGRCLPV